MKKLFTLGLLTSSLILTSCGGTESESESSKDAAKKNETAIEKPIKEIKIGEQVWMAENLNVEKFQNGDLIPEAKSKEEWKKAKKDGTPAWCYYENDEGNGSKTGKLYNWHAVMDPRGLAPKGWHVPSRSEWEKLLESVGGKNQAAKKLKSKTGWKYNGTDEFGFTAVAGGMRNAKASFAANKKCGYWWTSTISEDGDDLSEDEQAWRIDFSFRNENADIIDDLKCFGFSVRCVKN